MPSSIFTSIARMFASGAGQPDRRKDYLPSHRLLPPHMAGQKVYSDWSIDAAIDDGYKSSVYVYAALRRLAESAASIPWVVKERTESGWKRIPEHPLEILWEREPNGKMSRSDVVERLVQSLYIGGNSLLQKVLLSRSEPNAMVVGDVKQPSVKEIWPLQINGFTPITSRRAFITEYDFDFNGVRRKFRASSIIHVMFQDPSNPYWGMSPLQAIAREIDVSVSSITWSMNSFDNRAVADGAFVSSDPLTNEQYAAAKSRVSEQYSGTTNARSPWVLGGGWEWVQMSLTPIEMDFIESRKMTRDDILSVFGVPPVVAGFFEDATLANAEVSRRLYWADAVIPLLTRLAAALNRTLTPHFGDPNDIRLFFDVSGVEALRLNRESESRTFFMLQRGGIPYHEAAELVGLRVKSQGEVGDEPYGIMAMAPGKARQSPESPAQPKAMPDEEFDRMLQEFNQDE